LGKPEDEPNIGHFSENIKKAFSKKYILENAIPPKYTDKPMALALYFDLFLKVLPKGAARLAEKIQKETGFKIFLLDF